MIFCLSILASESISMFVRGKEVDSRVRLCAFVFVYASVCGYLFGYLAACLCLAGGRLCILGTFVCTSTSSQI